jgi:hypothetical protein
MAHASIKKPACLPFVLAVSARPEISSCSATPASHAHFENSRAPIRITTVMREREGTKRLIARSITPKTKLEEAPMPTRLMSTLAGAATLALASTSAHAAPLAVSNDPLLAYAILLGAAAIVVLLGLSAYSHRRH